MSDSKTDLAKMYPHPPECEATIYFAHGHHWVVHQDLVDAGYTHLEDFSIVRINGGWWELQGHTRAGWRIIGEHHANGLWWIEAVEEEGAPEAS